MKLDKVIAAKIFMKIYDSRTWVRFSQVNQICREVGNGLLNRCRTRYRRWTELPTGGEHGKDVDYHHRTDSVPPLKSVCWKIDGVRAPAWWYFHPNGQIMHYGNHLTWNIDGRLDFIKLWYKKLKIEFYRLYSPAQAKAKLIMNIKFDSKIVFRKSLHELHN